MYIEHRDLWQKIAFNLVTYTVVALSTEYELPEYYHKSTDKKIKNLIFFCILNNLC